jgi:hypothetical protein
MKINQLFQNLKHGKLDWRYIASSLVEYLRCVGRTSIILLIGIGLGRITTLYSFTSTDISLAIIIGTVIESILFLVSLLTGSSFARRIDSDGFLTVRGLVDALGHYYDQQPTNIKYAVVLRSKTVRPSKQQVILE